MAYDEDEELPQLELRKFNWEAFKPDRVVMLVGKRGTGKSVLLRDLLSHLSREYDGGVAMSPTPESQDMFREFMPDSCVFNEYSSEKIGEIVTKLRQFNHMGVYKRVFVLLDDCMFDASVLKSKQMRDIHMNGRTSLPPHPPPSPSTRCGLVLFMEQVRFLFSLLVVGGVVVCFFASPNRSTRPARVFAATPSPLRWTLGKKRPMTMITTTTTPGHLKILFLNIVQYVMDVPKAIRSQIDYVFALREPQRAYRENLYKNFFGIFPTYDEFSAAFDACTENYGCMVVDSTAKTNAIEDSAFWYRGSPNPPSVLLGSRDQWRLHHMFYTDPKSAAEAALGDPIPALTRLRLVD
nr:hypothetical protein [Pandoravirus belohorizontensis]